MMELIDWNKIDFKGKTSGEVDTICPSCSHERKPANQKKPCLRVNVDKGMGICHHCGAKALKPREVEKKYEQPNQEWQNFTKLKPATVKWFKDRCISQTTIITARITEEVRYNPIRGEKARHIAFNYFEGDTLVSKKFRTREKEFVQTKNCKKIFYGLNDIIGEKEIYIVEGEMDKLAMLEIGIANCISVPNGANDFTDVFDNCKDYLKDIETVFIAVDMDEPGQKLEKEIIKRFGKWRCQKITFKGKDANDDLMDSKLTLEEAIKNPTRYPVDGSFTAQDILSELIDLKRNGRPDAIKPKNPHLEAFGNVFSMIPGQLTTVTGIPKHGKSAFIDWMVLNLVNDLDVKASFYSPEHFPMVEHQAVLTEMAVGKPYLNDYSWNGDAVEAMTEQDIEDYAEWSKDKIWLTAPEKGETATWAWLLDKFKEQMFNFGIDIFVIDAFNKVNRKNPDSLGEINQVLADLTSFAQGYGVTVILIAHPKKPTGYEKGRALPVPDLYDIKGTGDFHDQTHNGLVVYRHFADTNAEGQNYIEVSVLKAKFKHQGTLGAVVPFEYDNPTGRFYPKGASPDRSCLFKEKPAVAPAPDNYNANKTIESQRNDDEWQLTEVDF